MITQKTILDLKIKYLKIIILLLANLKVFKKLPKKYLGRKVIDGDETDLRFLDPKNSIVGLIAKGKARYDQSGFVV
jgi:hypothetical protein